MRRRGLEPPPGYPGLGPQPCNAGVRSVLCVHCVQIVRGFWTRWTQWTIWMLPRMLPRSRSCPRVDRGSQARRRRHSPVRRRAPALHGRVRGVYLVGPLGVRGDGLRRDVEEAARASERRSAAETSGPPRRWPPPTRTRSCSPRRSLAGAPRGWAVAGHVPGRRRRRRQRAQQGDPDRATDLLGRVDHRRGDAAVVRRHAGVAVANDAPRIIPKPAPIRISDGSTWVA